MISSPLHATHTPLLLAQERKSNSGCFYPGLLRFLGSLVRQTPAGSSRVSVQSYSCSPDMAKRRRSGFSFARCGCFGGQARAKMAEEDYPVKLHIYDLSQGMARQLSTMVVGKAIEAIWHTGVVVYGKEYYFGEGIQQEQPGRSPYGTPVRVEDFGVTHVPKEAFEDFLKDISPRYTPANYNILTNNCNNFSNEAVQFLVGSTVPSYILDLPNEAMNSPIGALMLPMIQGLETTLRAGAVPQPPQFVPAPAAAMQTQPSSNSIEVQSRSTVAGNTTDDVGGIITPAAQPAPAAATQTQPSLNVTQTQTRSAVADKMVADKATDDGGGITIPPAVQPAAPAPAAVVKVSATVAASPDPLSEAKNRVHEEIKHEFASIMATGTVQAGEAAALAMRTVMERHGLRRASTAVHQRG